MGIMARSVNLTQFKIKGDITSQALMAKHFVSIDDTVDEKSMGFVQYDNQDKHDIQQIGEYLPFTLRIDTRKIPSVIIKTQVKKASDIWLADKPNLRRVPKTKKEEIRETIKSSLLSKTMPSPVLIDCVAHKDNLYVFSTSKSQVELVQSMIKVACDDISIIQYIPYNRAENILPDTLKAKLVELNQASSDSELSKLENNKWIGEDFLLWLMFKTGMGTAETISVDDKVIMQGDSKKITSTGESNTFNVVKTALKDNKKITTAKIVFEAGNEEFQIVLDSTNMFFKSFKVPVVKADNPDDVNEADGMFLDKMYFIEQAQTIFDTEFVNYLAFRLTSKWNVVLEEINEWVEE